VDSGSTNSTITFTNTSYGGWQGIVGYTCDASTLPANAICVFSPGEVIEKASIATSPYPPATTTLQVVVNNPPNSPALSSMLWWAGGLAGLLLFVTRRRMMRGTGGTIAMLIGVVLLATAASGLMACNSGARYAYPTPAGTSTITVHADADPFATPPTASNPIPPTQPCGGQVGVLNPPQGNPASFPCSQTTFQISLTVN
jgi:hypothetical protein